MLEERLTFEELGEKINDNFFEDVKYKDSSFNIYAFSEQLKEPNILIAVEMAYELGVNLNYLYGLDFGELIYPEPQTVSSLLTNLFRALTIAGVNIDANFTSNEIIISPTNKYFQEFFEKVDLSEDLESNFPVVFQITLDYIQDRANTRINIDQLQSEINKNEFYKQIDCIRHFKKQP